MTALRALCVAAACIPVAAAAQSVPAGFKLVGVVQGPVTIACQDPPPADPAQRQCIVLAMPSGVAPTAGGAGAAATDAVAAATPAGGAAAGALAAAAPEAAASAPVTATTATAAKSEADKKSAFEKLADYAQLDLSVPNSPAFAVLGITPDKVQRPGTINDFAASLIRGLGKDGKPVSGFAVDMAPASVFFKRYITGGSDYGPANGTNDLNLTNYWKRVLARTTVSLATTSAEASGASRSAWGVRVGLYDQGDPGLYWEATAKCLRETTMPVLKGGKGLDPTPAGTSLDKCNPLTNDVMDKPLWAQPAVYAGFGKSWYSQSGALTDRAPDVTAYWISGSYGMFAGKPKDEVGAFRFLLQGYLGRKLNDRTPDPNDATKLLREDSNDVALRLKLGKENWHTFLESGRARVRLGGDTKENRYHTSVGAEFKLGFGDNLWVQVASVNERGLANGKTNTGVTMNLKFGAPFLELPGTK